MSDHMVFSDDPSFDIRYWLDVGDVIVDVDAGWENFARENDAPELEIRRIIGRNLLSFVQGDVTRMYVRTLIQSARLQRKPLVRPYRCDSPELRRYMEMRLTLEDSGLLCWEHRLLKVEPLARRMHFESIGTRVMHHCVVRCSMCNRLKSPSGWVQPDQAEIDQPDDKPIPVIYGVCPECMNMPLSGRGRAEGR